MINIASTTGLKKETAAALTTLLGPTLIVPVLFLLLEKDEFVKFWAVQSLVVYIFLFALNRAFAFSVVLIILMPLVFVLGVILWLIMTYKAWQGDTWKVPLLGKFIDKLLVKS